MEKLIIKIECGNASFEDAPSECARILRILADKLESGAVLVPRDINGNKCGSVEVIG